MMRERSWSPGWPVSLNRTLKQMRRGRNDPVIRIEPDGSAAWWATQTPEGPAVLRMMSDAPTGRVEGAAWGAGAAWALEVMPELLGASDDPSTFDPGEHPLVRQAWRRFGDGLRIPRSRRVIEALIPAVLEQRVTGKEAWRAWAALVAANGHDPTEAVGGTIPGLPSGMRVPPDVPGWRAIPSWDWHRAGVERARSDTVQRALSVAGRLEEALLLERDAAERRLRSVRGIGEWTVAEIAIQALGDADAVSFGDYHLGRFVVYALTGEVADRGESADRRMADLLAQWPGHRQRVIRLLALVSDGPPARGPRYSPLDHRNR